MQDIFQDELYLLNDGAWAGGSYWNPDIWGDSPPSGPNLDDGGNGIWADLVGSALAVAQGTSSQGVSVKERLTALANSTETQLRANLSAVSAGTLSTSDGLQNAWNLLNGMVSQMLNYGTQGRISAAERDKRIDPSLLRWDWIANYIQPMMGNGEALQPLPVQVQTGLGGSLQTGGGWGSSPIQTQDRTWLYVALALVVVWALKRKG